MGRPLLSSWISDLMVLEVLQGFSLAHGERPDPLPGTNSRLLHLADHLHDGSKPDLCLDGCIIELWFK